MFLSFFYLLRKSGIKVSLTEWITLLEALEAGLHENTMSGFYALCRTVIVKSESDFDRFDEVFLDYFKDIPMSEQEVPEEFMKWLNKKVEERPYQPWFDEENEIDIMEIEKKFKARLKDQNSEHNKGHKWIGTKGHTAYGNSGKELGGIRVGGSSTMKSAYRVASERKYRDWRNDNVIDSRQFQMAFRALRQLSDHSIQEKTELDVDGTIQKTCDNAGRLEIVKKAPRKNVIKLLLLIDSGGSMDSYQQLCSMLFQSVSKAGNFDDLKIYYFHNYLEKSLFLTPQLEWDKCVPTDWVLNNLNETYKVIIVGDGEMALDELYSYDWYRPGEPKSKSGMDRFMEFKRKYRHIIWLHPEDEPQYITYWTKSFFALREVFPMYKLSIDGLKEGVRKLLSR